MSRAATFAGVASVVVALGAGACQLVAGLDGTFTQAPVSDAGAGAGDAGSDAASEAGPPGCQDATYPDPPGGTDDGISKEIVLALRSLDFGEGATTPPGYDLDHVCTCFDDAGPTCTSGQQHCDAPGGIDSASAQIFTLIQFAAGTGNFGSAAFSAKADKGYFSLLIRVTDYNGKADDPVVNVAIYPSSGAATTPVWDGTDQWSVDQDSVTGADPNKPLYTSAGAYVAKGTLVAAVPNILVALGATQDTITLRLTDGVITGTLVEQGGMWSITGGVIAARWAQKDIFAALSSYRDSNNMPICTDQTLAYPTAKGAICKGLDILADSSGAASLPCDALSMGFGFTAQQAQLGMVTPPPMPTPGCPSATNPINDMCF